MKIKCLNIASFVKIRQIFTSSKAHQRPLNRGCFCHLFYPIRAPETLPECEYDIIFSGDGLKKRVVQDSGILYRSITHCCESASSGIPASHPAYPARARPSGQKTTACPDTPSCCFFFKIPMIQNAISRHGIILIKAISRPVE